MNPQITKVLRAIAAIVVLSLLLLTVLRWWREYRAAPQGGGASIEATATSPGSEKEGSGSETAGGSAAEGSADVVVVLTDGLNLREKPEADAKALRGLNKDERLTLVRTQGAWYLVKTAEGDEGWVSSNPSYSKIVKR